MAITLITPGTAASATSSPITPDWPASLAAGDYCILLAAVKYGDKTIDTPTGFTLLDHESGGLGSDGSTHQGTVRLAVFGKIADGSESGTISVTASGSLSLLWARTVAFRSGTGSFLVGTPAKGDSNSNTTAVAFAYGSDPGLTAGDWALSCWAVNSSAFAVSSHALSASGLSSVTSTSRINSAVSIGTFARVGLVTHEIVTGTSAGNATYSHTASGSNTVAPTGSSILIRLREDSAGGTAYPLFMHNYRQRRSA